ncbi:MAG: response regulator [Eubacterium sp.]|nr:response regulator [Eubacterium sp.]
MERRKIMVVDDNTVNLATIEQDLKDVYDVIPMISGRRAIKYLYTQKVDLILLDVEMPGQDGIETLQEIRTQDNGVTVPVIFLTANKDRSTVIEGSKLGIMDYIVKPVGGEELIHRIERAFKRLGMVPVGEKELLQMAQKVEDYIIQKQIPQAIALAEEIAGYQIEEEIAGRMRNIRTKLSQGCVPEATNTIQRIITVLETRLGVAHSVRTIDSKQLMTKLLGVEHLIENFETREALNSCKDILKYNLNDNIRNGIQEVLECLSAFDDDGAMQLLGNLYHELKESE